jgi:putative transposase
MIPAIKEEYPWLKEVSAQSLQHVCKNIDTAYNNFFKQNRGYPKFKKRKSKESFQIPQGFKIDVDKSTIKLPKLNKPLKVVFTRPVTGEVKSLSVTRYSTGKVFINILVDNGLSTPTKVSVTPETTVGVDLGLIDRLVLSNGVKIAGVKVDKKFDGRLAYRQRIFAKNKYNGNKRKKKIALLHEKKRFQSEDAVNKISYTLVKDYDTICMEDLSVANLKRNRSLSKSFNRQSLGRLQELIKYKCEVHGKNYLEVPRFYPSSKTCSTCGLIKKTLSLSDRTFVCEKGHTMDRDINAAINIKNEGLKLLGFNSSGSTGFRVKNQKELSQSGITLTGDIEREALITED